MTGDDKPDGSEESGAQSYEYEGEWRVARRALRSNVNSSHFGLLCVALTLTVIFYLDGPKWAIITGGAFTAWFTLALGVILIRGGRGWDAIQRAYIATFGWGDFISP